MKARYSVKRYGDEGPMHLCACHTQEIGYRRNAKGRNVMKRGVQYIAGLKKDNDEECCECAKEADNG